ncbi:MAG TPA: AAA family ATPase [Sphaerochaeta sp.]|nr:AAA family ATPase [Sphaerochaeta sp.]
MKILELRFKNLNSLYGEWHIDFTESEYTYNGIFALTGPTGAGKSTILDAICLALYGSTPRLGRITQSSNDIMSRQTGECYAEVVFASQAGRFRCNWAQHRSRKKPEGELQSPKHEIAEANAEGKILENKLTAVLTAVEEKTGMDFDRFTRSILLAQGGFDTFLKASVEQKSKILEQITGTKIYSEISIGVHERLREEKATFENLLAETRGITILTAEEEESIEEELKTSQQKESTLALLVSDLHKAITWLTGITQLEKELEALSEQEKLLAHDTLSFEIERTALDRAIKAATLDGVYATLTEMRSQQKGEKALLEQEKLGLPVLEVQAKAGTEALVKAEEGSQQAKHTQKEELPIIRQVRSLDQNLKQLKTSITEGTTSLDCDKTSIKSYRLIRDKEMKKAASEQNKLDLVATYQREHVKDKELVTDLTGISEQILSLSTRQKEVVQKEAQEKKAAKVLKDAEKALATSTKLSLQTQGAHAKAIVDLQGKKGELSLVLGERLLREYRTEKEALLREREFLARIAALEEHRNHLIDGKECPLCGSLEHPFALGNVPKSDEIERKIEDTTKIIYDAETLETKIQHQISIERDASTALTEQKKNESDALHAKESALSAHKTSLAAVSEVQESFVAMEKVLAEKLKAYDIQEIPEDLPALMEELRLRKDVWLAKEQETRELESTIGAIKGEIQRLTGVIDTQEVTVEAKQASLVVLSDTYTLAEQERLKLYGDKDPESEEEKLSSALLSAETAEKRASKACTDLLQKVSATKTKIESLQASLASREPVLQTKESFFAEELSTIGFPDEQQFLSARLPLAERNRLASLAKALDDRQTALITNVHDRTTRLALEQAKNLTEKPLADLQSSVERQEAELQGVRETVADHRARLKGNGEAKLRIESRLSIIEAQRKECTTWERLHSLIGSADGKKFRNFAQGLTFELMVGHANMQLAKMSDRYLLIRSDEQPLELNVIDNYQAGEIRSTKNLSGGESFIISLTLALGLSKMASRKVRVDSLFLDEGFGTLDEASLETALKTLSSLQQDGKLIGVISHVSAMQEMISTQIVITPASGGKSILSGPGCNRIE